MWGKEPALASNIGIVLKAEQALGKEEQPKSFTW